MKFILLSVFMLSCGCRVFGQDPATPVEIAPDTVGVSDEAVIDPIVDKPDESAEFPGGIDKLFAYLGQNIIYPIEAVIAGDQGRVMVRFIVDKDGSLSDIAVDRGVTPELDREAVRVVAAMPRWTPARLDGRPVRSLCNLPITFRINNK